MGRGARFVALLYNVAWYLVLLLQLSRFDLVVICWNLINVVTLHQVWMVGRVNHVGTAPGTQLSS